MLTENYGGCVVQIYLVAFCCFQFFRRKVGLEVFKINNTFCLALERAMRTQKYSQQR